MTLEPARHRFGNGYGRLNRRRDDSSSGPSYLTVRSLQVTLGIHVGRATERSHHDAPIVRS